MVDFNKLLARARAAKAADACTTVDDVTAAVERGFQRGHMPNKEDKLGALWNKNKNGKDFFTGQVEIDGVKHAIVVFSNGFKDADNKPDWIIYRSQPRQ